MHKPYHLARDTDEPRAPQESADPRRWKALAVIRPGAEKLDLLPLFGRLDAPPTARSAPHPGPPLPAAILSHPQDGKHAITGRSRPSLVPLCAPDITARFAAHSGE
jgi:hypothetical protein